MIDFITPAIRYIGCDDKDLDLFESQYATPAGMCYNSYLLTDEKTVIFDTVDPRCETEWLAKVHNALQGRTPDYLILHHLEPDHSGALAAILGQFPTLRVVCSAQAAKYLPQFFEHFDTSRIIVVKEGDTLSTGHHTLRFIQATFVHWPEVIMTFCPEAGVLFSADGFGKFGTYDADADDWACEARRYYFNICGKYGAQVQRVLEKVELLPTPPTTICPLHGPILQGEAMVEAMKLYHTWANYEVESPGIFIAHASIHGGTAKAAEFLREKLLATGCPKVAIADLCREDMAEAIEDAFRYGTLVCCASSYDGDVFPPMHCFLHKLTLKGYQKRRIALLENGTWAPSAARAMKEIIAKMKDIDLVEPVITIRSRMKQGDIPSFDRLVKELVTECPRTIL